MGFGLQANQRARTVLRVDLVLDGPGHSQPSRSGQKSFLSISLSVAASSVSLSLSLWNGL
jgi:hypothetical protein